MSRRRSEGGQPPAQVSGLRAVLRHALQSLTVGRGSFLAASEAPQELGPRGVEQVVVVEAGPILERGELLEPRPGRRW